MITVNNISVCFSDSQKSVETFIVSPKFINWIETLDYKRIDKLNILSIQWYNDVVDPLKLYSFNAKINYLDGDSEFFYVMGTKASLLVKVYVEEYDTNYYILSNFNKVYNDGVELCSGIIDNSGNLFGDKFTELRMVLNQPIPNTQLLENLGQLDTDPLFTDKRVFLFQWNLEMSSTEFGELNNRIYDVRNTIPLFRVYSEDMLIKLFDSDTKVVDAKTEIAYRRSKSDNTNVVVKSSNVGYFIGYLFILYMFIVNLSKLLPTNYDH